MSIIQKVIDKRNAMKADTSGSLATQNRDMAVRAMMDGLESTAWEIYMKQFAGSAEELARLTTRDPAMTEDMRAKRAYIIGNAICGSGTPGNFHMGVNTIDQGLGGCLDREQLPPHDPYPTSL